MGKKDRNVAGRYRIAVILLLLLFAAAVGSLIWWSYAPESRWPLALAGIFLAWLMVVGLIAAARVYRHMIRPVLQISAYLKSLARGEMPPPLKLRSAGRISFPELVAAVNLLRDRMVDTSAKLRTMQEQELEEMRGEEGAYLLNRLITAMSREFYQPLSVANGCLYQLKQDPAPEIRREVLHCLQLQTEDISERAGRISRLGSLAARSAERSEQQTFDTAALIQEIEQNSRKFLRREQLKMTLRYPNEFPARLQGDREELRQLLTLLVRAIGKAALPGSNVEWTLLQADHGLEFRFSCSAYREISGDLPRILEEYRAGKYAGASDDTALPLPLLRFLWGEAAAIRCQSDLAVDYRKPFGMEIVLTLHPVWICESEWGTVAGAAQLTGSADNALTVSADAALPASILLAGTERDFAEVIRLLYPDCRLELLPENGKLTGEDPDVAIIFAGADTSGEFLHAASLLAKREKSRLFAVVDARGCAAEQKLRSAGVCRFLAAPVDFAALDRMIAGDRSRVGHAG